MMFPGMLGVSKTENISVRPDHPMMNRSVASIMNGRRLMEDDVRVKLKCREDHRRDPVDDLSQIDNLLAKGIDNVSIANVDKVKDLDPNAVIARELNQLSMEERDAVLHDIHGVANTIDEKPGFVTECLNMLQAELDKISDKNAYDLAFEADPDYVRGHDLRIMFLRALRFDPSAAAQRMVTYFDQKLKLFGSSKLTKKICVSDLGPEEMAFLESGWLQLLPGRDRAGRAVLITMGQYRPDKPLQAGSSMEAALKKMVWYVFMVALEDEETQKRGVVLISYAVGSSIVDRSYIYPLASVPWALPISIVSLHACVDSPTVAALCQAGSLFVGSRWRIRLRCHLGSDIECKYKLMTFGIPSRILPVSQSGEIGRSAHLEWIETRRRVESRCDDDKLEQGGNVDSSATSSDSSSSSLPRVVRVVVPGPLDVLLGRGKFIQEHSGNLKYRHIIENHLSRYESASKADKTHIAKEVVDIVHEKGGRFLKQSGEGWVEVNVEVARDKVGHSFRNRRSAINIGPKQSQQQRGVKVSTPPDSTTDLLPLDEIPSSDSKRLKFTAI